MRVAGATLVLVPVAAVLRRRVATAAVRRQWRLLLPYGVLGVAGCQSFYFVAASRLPVGVAILLEFTGPLLIVGWTRFVVRTALPRSAAIGVGIALARPRLRRRGVVRACASTCSACSQAWEPRPARRAYFLLADRVEWPDRPARHGRGRLRGGDGDAGGRRSAMDDPLAGADRHRGDRWPHRARLAAGEPAGPGQHRHRVRPERRRRAAALGARRRRRGATSRRYGPRCSRG